MIRHVIIRIALIVILVSVFMRFGMNSTSPAPKPPVDPPATSADMLIKYDANNKAKLPDKGAMIDSVKFRDFLVQHHVDWRIVPSSTTFNDDQPKFQKLDAQERKGDNWLYLDNGRRIGGNVSVPLPENEDAAEKLIGRYAK